MTHRLYHADSYLIEFAADVVETRPWGERLAVVLDRTAFYPTSGGQPHDLGTLDGHAVVDVVEDGERILHITAETVTGQVVGRIDWPRRVDHMQQHTGQHIVSQAFLQVLGAQTRSVHFGVEVSTIDLALVDLSAEEVGRVEDLANATVLEDRVVRVSEVDETALGDLELRRPPKRRGRLRIVEVEGFDRSACGGTHVRRTGEVGPVKIRRWERAKGGVRAEFLCGWRALRDYQWKNALVVDFATRFTVKDRDVGTVIERLAEQLRDRERALAELRDQVLGVEANERVRAVEGSPKIIAEVLSGRSADELATLAGHIVFAASAVVLFGTTEGKLVFARSADVGVDVGRLIRRVAEAVGGRGGGRPQFAQGAVPSATVSNVVHAAGAEVMRLLNEVSG